MPMDRPKHGTPQEKGYGWIIGLAIIIAVAVVLYLAGALHPPH